jgi:hypothetical protein
MTDQQPSPYRTHVRTRVAQFDLSRPGSLGGQYSAPIPVDPGVKEAETCPQAIVDTDPEGHGLGVWVLVDTQTKPDGVYCVYEYSGGIV